MFGAAFLIVVSTLDSISLLTNVQPTTLPSSVFRGGVVTYLVLDVKVTWIQIVLQLPPSATGDYVVPTSISGIAVRCSYKCTSYCKLENVVNFSEVVGLFFDDIKVGTRGEELVVSVSYSH